MHTRVFLRMSRRFVFGVVAVGVVVVAMYGALRPTEDAPQLPTTDALERQAAQIEAHRKAQKPAVEAGSTVVPPYWTDFRGPLRDGHYRERPIATNWPANGLQPIWKQPTGGGHASFVVAHGRAFTIEQRASHEVVAAYDIPTGRELWTHGWPAMFAEAYGGIGPRATPTWHQGTVFALGAGGELRAIDATTGALRWQTNILQDAGAANLEWGMAASPLVVGDRVIVVPGGEGNAALVAYDRKSGKPAWSALSDAAAYSSPMVTRLAGIEQIVTYTATRVVSLSLDGTRVLWEFRWGPDNGINVAQPLIVGENRVFLSSGYGTGAVMVEVTRQGELFSVREIWRTNRMKNQFTSSVHHDGYIYGLDESILACIDAASGDLKWKGGRYGYGQVLLASGHLIVVTDTGELALVRATPDGHRELARFPVLDGRTWNHPALADGYLLIRNANEMAAFDLRVR